MGFETQDIERKELAILKILSGSEEPMGARIIAHRLKDFGIELGERAVRYHLKLMDERGLTQLVGRRDGRALTERGVDEVRCALVKDKVGFAISRIEQLAFRTDFNPDTRTGSVPVNISLFPKEEFGRALQAMKPAFESRLCVSDLVAVAREGDLLGELVIPRDKVGLATVCSVVINGALLKLGVPLVSRFSGILQIRNSRPLRFIELIQYSGCTLDPSEIFIRAGMTSVLAVARKGEGKILATYREIPAICKPIVEKTVAQLKESGLGGLLMMGSASEPVCEIPVEPNRIGIIIVNGLNTVAAAAEAGIAAENHGMSTTMEYRNLV
ncbi:MAG: NrpR regulatory domain-containing protein, partial [Dehalococcoidales bacterium]|nr:NrpR regulatory domain-containing protein [Dehalococcoidales bacterium]